MSQRSTNQELGHSPNELVHAEGDFSAMVGISHETVAVNGLYPLCQPEDIGFPSHVANITQSVVARLAVPLGGQGEVKFGHFVVVRQTVGTAQPTFGLRGLKMSYLRGRPRVTYLPLLPIPVDGSDLTIGRSSTPDGKVVGIDRLLGAQQFSTAVSARHVSLAVRENTVGVQDHSTNGTRIAAGKYSQRPKVMLPESSYEANHTVVVGEIARIIGHLRNGEYAGRKIINHSTEVGGASPFTVDYRSWSSGGEAIVVDSNGDNIQNREEYKKYYDGAVSRIVSVMHAKGFIDDMDVLSAIGDTVYKNMQYDIAWVFRDVSARYKLSPNGSRKVNLSYYMNSGKGVCRHMGLAAAWLGGELRQAGYLKHGKVTAPVKQTGNDEHEYALYTNELTGEEIAIDPANDNYVGPPITGFWDYRNSNKLPDVQRKDLHYEKEGRSLVSDMRRLVRAYMYE